MKVVEKEYLVTPHGNTVVWRYMPLDGFLDLLVNERLFFCNSKRLEDRFEGSTPRRSREAEKARLKELGLTGRDLEEEMIQFDSIQMYTSQGTLINCWSLSPRESFALWKIYLGGSPSGVAIKSTVGRIRRALIRGKDPFPEDVYIGKVNYSNFVEPADFNRFTAITTKHPAYEYEKELRIFVLGYPKSEGGRDLPYRYGVGRHVSVDIDSLVENLHPSPFAEPWSDEMLKSVVSRLRPSLSKRIVASEMRDY